MKRFAANVRSTVCVWIDLAKALRAVSQLLSRFKIACFAISGSLKAEGISGEQVS